MDEALSASLR